MKIALNPNVNFPITQQDVQYHTSFTSNNEKFVYSPELVRFKMAEKYAKKQISRYSYVDLDNVDLRRLEGIQYGIDVFKGLNIKQIHLLYKYLSAIILYRGCSNGCVHCFLDAKPVSIHPAANTVQAISWEDFESLIKGFDTLNQRLGHTKTRHSDMEHGIIAPFMDSDSMEIILKDKTGGEHDIIEVSKAFDSIYRKTLFDTSGWTPKSSKMQQRAKKYVDFINSNREDFCINLSLNPFHKLYSKYVENINKNPEVAKHFRDLYVSRMANAFLTFAPVMDYKEFYVINRAARDNSKCDTNYQFAAHNLLIIDIKEKLKSIMEEKRLPKGLVDKYLSLFEEKTGFVDTERLLAMGRMRDLFSSDDKYLTDMNQISEENANNPSKMFTRGYKGLLVDCNGKVYLFDNYDIAETDICLNLENKDKTTPKLITLKDKIFTTKELIDGFGERQSKNLCLRILKFMFRK